MLSGIRNLAVGALVLALVAASCSAPLPTTGPPDSELRLQIHAATGHEPPECTDFGDSAATIEITATGLEPACVKVGLQSVLTISNDTSSEQRFLVGDPANSEVGRHIRVDQTIAAGKSTSVDPVDSLLDADVYPFWVQGRQEQGYVGSLVVQP